MVQPQFAKAGDVDAGKVPVGVTRLPEYEEASAQDNLPVPESKSNGWQGFDVSSGSTFNTHNTAGAANPNYVPASDRQPASSSANAVAGSTFGVSADTQDSAGWTGNSQPDPALNNSGAATGTYAAQQDALKNQHQQALQQLGADGSATANQYTTNPIGTGLGALRNGWR